MSVRNCSRVMNPKVKNLFVNPWTWALPILALKSQRIMRKTIDFSNLFKLVILRKCLLGVIDGKGFRIQVTNMDELIFKSSYCETLA